jgi:hypothetical protein
MAPVDKIMNINCVKTTERAPRKLAQLARREGLTMIPLVNQKNELMDVFIAYEPTFSGKK